MNYTQILEGERQTGKTTWLADQAVRWIENRNLNEAAIVIGSHSQVATDELVNRIRTQRNNPMIKIFTKGTVHQIRGTTTNVKDVLVLVDELDLPKSEQAAQAVLDTLYPAAPQATIAKRLATRTINEVVA